MVDFLPPETAVLLHEPAELGEQAKRFVERSPRHEELLPWQDVTKRWASFPNATSSAVTEGHLGAVWQLPIDPIEKFSGDIGELRIQVERLGRDANGQECDVFLLARVAGEIPRVNEILGSTALASSGRLHVGLGCVHNGFRLRDSRQVLLGCDQMFHRTELRRRGRRRLGKAIDSFLDLREGDLIVHLSHGIGRFRGLEMLDKDGQRTEHLKLEFHGRHQDIRSCNQDRPGPEIRWWYQDPPQTGKNRRHLLVQTKSIRASCSYRPGLGNDRAAGQTGRSRRDRVWPGYRMAA